MTQASLFSKTPPTLARARAKGHAGARRAAARADAVQPDWLDDACAAILFWAQAWDRPFLIEEAREALVEGYPAPSDPRAWGHAVRVLKARGQIEPAGYAPAKSSHGSPKCLWRVRR